MHLFWLKNKKSFTLIELSVVLIVIGCLTAASAQGLSYVKNYLNTKQTQIKIQNVQLALQNYFTDHQRLPRPALYSVATNASDFGYESDSPLSDNKDTLFYTNYKVNIQNS